MPTSIIVDGKVLDFRYSKRQYGYLFYIGDTLIGEIFNMGRREWSSVSYIKPNKLCPMDGFRTRYHASEFLLKINGYR